MTVCRKNFHYAQDLQKQAYNKGVEPKSYVYSDKIWLNNKYIKTKRNWKLEVKFFVPFQVLYLVGKQDYKLELPKKWRIHNIFYMLLLEQDITRREWVDKNVTELEFKAGDSEEYKIEAICDNAINAKEAKSHLPGLYYLALWKGYSKEENT